MILTFKIYSALNWIIPLLPFHSIGEDGWRKMKNCLSCKAKTIGKIPAIQFGLRYIGKTLPRLWSPALSMATKAQPSWPLGLPDSSQPPQHAVHVSSTGILDTSDWVFRLLLFCTAHSSTPAANHQVLLILRPTFPQLSFYSFNQGLH